jgi:hypothetical protein
MLDEDETMKTTCCTRAARSAQRARGARRAHILDEILLAWSPKLEAMSCSGGAACKKRTGLVLTCRSTSLDGALAWCSRMQRVEEGGKGGIFLGAGLVTGLPPGAC